MSDLSKSAQRVQDTLTAQALPFQVVQFPESTRTAEEAANAVGCQVAQICKSLIFKTKNTARPVLVLASGINRVNEALITEYVGEKIVRADADFTRDVTGFAIGGIPPVAHHTKIEHIFIDESLLSFDTI